MGFGPVRSRLKEDPARLEGKTDEPGFGACPMGVIRNEWHLTPRAMLANRSKFGISPGKRAYLFFSDPLDAGRFSTIPPPVPTQTNAARPR